MHEASLMEGILLKAEEVLLGYQVEKVNTLYVRAGKLANIMSHALEFAFESQTTEGIFLGAKLELEITPVEAHCNSCGRDYHSDDIPLVCPYCDSREATITAGTEVYLASIDFDGEVK